MNLEQIRIAAQLHIGVSMEKPFARRFANEGMMHLCHLFPYTAMKKKKVTLTNVERGVPVELPEGLVYKVKHRDALYAEFEILDDEIEFNHAGDFVIYYHKRPEPLNAESDVPEIPEAFHPSLALLVAAREKFRLFGEEDVDSIRLMREFSETARMASDFMDKHGRRRIVKARDWW